MAGSTRQPVMRRVMLPPVFAATRALGGGAGLRRIQRMEAIRCTGGGTAGTARRGVRLPRRPPASRHAAPSRASHSPGVTSRSTRHALPGQRLRPSPARCGTSIPRCSTRHRPHSGQATIGRSPRCKLSMFGASELATRTGRPLCRTINLPGLLVPRLRSPPATPRNAQLPTGGPPRPRAAYDARFGSSGRYPGDRRYDRQAAQALRISGTAWPATIPGTL